MAKTMSIMSLALVVGTAWCQPELCLEDEGLALIQTHTKLTPPGTLAALAVASNGTSELNSSAAQLVAASQNFSEASAALAATVSQQEQEPVKDKTTSSIGALQIIEAFVGVSLVVLLCIVFTPRGHSPAPPKQEPEAPGVTDAQARKGFTCC
eukprot:TRINITY_DN75051_c0_g1_i1.p1 TRINITY_DN75051_c0_g1~~TRINITY_DN75051_c0_g1_i1.p1  ORF type:complete len:178 (+),score=25.78 TRINITY_DN75051_c0_g1_i1:76-534(+)